MIYEHKNLHISAPNPCASALHIDYTQATTQLEALGKSLSNADTRRAFLPTFVIGEVR